MYEEEQILQWLMTQKDPSGEVIEALEGEDLLNLIRESESLAVYFCKFQNIVILCGKKKLIVALLSFFYLYFYRTRNRN